ncbi:MAG: formylglycine-generating enzyme family protein, partial [Nitrospiria bacterium]
FFKTNALPSLGSATNSPFLPHATQKHPTEERLLLDGSCLHCHADKTNLDRDISKAECQECHGEPSLPNVPVQISDIGEQEIILQKMIEIPAGRFIMGSPGRPASEGRGNADEGPPHEVFVETFYLDLYETTNAHYQEYINATDARAPLLFRNGTYPPAIANHPVVYVSWFDADAFCAWRGKRLATESEWEKAARGDDQRHFPWGTQFDAKRANTPQYSLSKGVSVSKGGTMPVGSFENGKSPYGLYDMAGNVYEWVSNWYMPYPGNQVPNVHYGRRNKVLRGGSWYDCMSYGCGLSSPVYNRSRFTPEIKNKGFGFRCASDHLISDKHQEAFLQ